MLEMLPPSDTKVGSAVPALPKTIPYFLAEQIRHGIITGKYRPGASLREQDLSEMFGISRGPVRESLRLLELQGLVNHAPRRGFRVKEYSESDIESLYRLRVLIEGAVIDGLEGRVLGPLVEELNAINEGMLQATQSRDLDAYFEYNIKFHQAIIDFTVDDYLIRVISIINDMTLPLRYLLHYDRFPESNDHFYHGEIISHLSAKKLDKAKALTVKHIEDNLPLVKNCYRQAVADG